MVLAFIFFLLKILLLYFAWNFLFVLYKKYFRKPLELLSRYGKGSYVIVTGATNGIGKEFCNQFAKKGFNLILVSRTPSNLQAVSEEFKKSFPEIDVKTIEFDFTKKTTLQDYLEAFDNEDIKNLDISVLVNNIGISTRELFKDMTFEYITNSINVNIISQTYLNKIFINRFLSRKDKCAIISLSSYGSGSPLAYSSIYCSTKIYDDYLLRSIAFENMKSNIDFLVVKPIYVDTPSRRGHSREMKAISAEDCVKGALNDLGYDMETYGDYRHCIQAVFGNLIPTFAKNIARMKSSKKKAE